MLLMFKIVLLFVCLVFIADYMAATRGSSVTGSSGKDGDRRGGFQAAAKYSRRNKGVSMVVIRGGNVVFEDNAGKPHRLASGTKSFWGVLAMAAVQDGLFKLDELVADTITEWRTDRNKSGITVRELLNFTSGLDPAVELLRGKPNSSDKFGDALSITTYDRPGTSFSYGPSHLTLFGEFLKRKLSAAGKHSDPLDYLQQRIFNPIGIKPTRWSRDKGGNPIMASGAHFTAREWGKFGELINKGGSWKGTQVVDRALIDEILIGSRVNPAYGLTFWLNKDSKGAQLFSVADGRSKKRARSDDGDGFIYKGGPTDLVMAAGQGKQRLYIIRSLDMVVVRQGDSKGKGWSDKEFLKLVISDANGGSNPAIDDNKDNSGMEAKQNWRVVCQQDIDRICPNEQGNRRALRGCFKKNRRAFSAECRTAVKNSR